MRRTTFSFYNRKISSRRRSTRTFISASNDKPAVVILPGLGNATEDYEEFKEELSSRGFVATSIAQVARLLLFLPPLLIFIGGRDASGTTR